MSFGKGVLEKAKAPTQSTVGALHWNELLQRPSCPVLDGLHLGFLHMKDADLLARIATDTKTAGAIAGLGHVTVHCQDMEKFGGPGRNRPSGPLLKMVPNPQLGLSLLY